MSYVGILSNVEIITADALRADIASITEDEMIAYCADVLTHIFNSIKEMRGMLINYGWCVVEMGEARKTIVDANGIARNVYTREENTLLIDYLNSLGWAAKFGSSGDLHISLQKNRYD